MRARVVLTLLCAASAFAGIAPPASPAPPAPGAVVEELALASWTFPTREPGRLRWLFAGAFRETVAGGRTKTFAFAVKGTCRAVRGSRSSSCHGRGAGGAIPAERFHVDPSLGSARLDLSSGGRVVWTAARRTPPYGYLAGEACDAGTGQGAGMERAAPARGRLFGMAASRSAVETALLARGAMVTECARALAEAAASGDVVRVVLPR